MSSLEETAAKAKDALTKSNPSNSPVKPTEARKRIPMSLPVQKLEVPEIPGFHLHWFRGTAARIQQAERAGFLFVRTDEVSINNLSLGGDATKTGNSDMGDRVSVTAGDTDDQGQAVRLYLMKQPSEYYLEDRKILQDRNDSIADALTASFKQGVPVGPRAEGEQSDDVAARYVDRKRSKVPDLFRRKGRS